MKIIQFLLITLFTVGCAHHGNPENASRILASAEDSKLTAQARLKILVDETKKVKDIFPVLGNPRYYLMENFLERTSKTMKSLEKNDSELMQTLVFVPKDKDVAKEFLSIVAAHKVMNNVGIYLNFNYFVEKDSDEVVEYLRGIDQIISFYDQDLKSMMGLGAGNQIILGVEDRQIAMAKEYHALVQYLGRRISSHLKEFVPKKKKRKKIKKFLKKIRKHEFVDPQDTVAFFSKIKNSKSYVKAKKVLGNLSLPESSDINGSDDAFEKVMSVQMSLELIEFTFNRDII